MKLLPKITALLFFAVSVITVGCSDPIDMEGTMKKNEGSEGSHSTIIRTENSNTTVKKDNSFENLHDDAILISVNGKNLTKGMFMKWVRLRVKINSGSMDKMFEGKDSTSMVRAQMLASVTNEYPRQIVVGDYALENGIAIATNFVEICRRGFMINAKAAGKSWEKALANFNEAEKETINDRVITEASMLAVSENFFRNNPVEVTQEDINELYNGYLEYNKKCTASNNTTWAVASNIWNRISSGESFEDLAVQFDEDEYREADGIWGDFHVSDFADEPEIWKLASKFRPGYVSRPIEADNGITILKVNSIEDAGCDVNAPDYAPSPSAEINISRIFLHLPLFMEEIDKEQFAKECLNAKRTAAFNKFIIGLLSRATIEFPCGTDIFDTEGKRQRQHAIGS